MGVCHSGCCSVKETCIRVERCQRNTSNLIMVHLTHVFSLLAFNNIHTIQQRKPYVCLDAQFINMLNQMAVYVYDNSINLRRFVTVG